MTRRMVPLDPEFESGQWRRSDKLYLSSFHACRSGKPPNPDFCAHCNQMSPNKAMSHLRTIRRHPSRRLEALRVTIGGLARS